MYLEDNDSPTFPDAGVYWQSTSNAYGEMRYICPGINLSSVFSDRGVKSWNYHDAVEDPDAMQSGAGVSHTVEVNATWGPEYVSKQAPPSYTTINAPIIPVMQGYWTSFIRSFDPNKHHFPGSPEWKTWKQSDDGYNRLLIKTGETRMEMVPQDQRKRCEC